MMDERELDSLLAALDPERARRLLGLSPDRQAALDAHLEARAQAEAPQMEAARARLLARLEAPPRLVTYLEQHGLRIWSAAAEALVRFVVNTEHAAETIRRELFDASQALVPAHFGPPLDAATTRLTVHGWGSSGSVELTCKTRVLWNPEGSLTFEAWIPPGPLAAFPGLQQGYGLVRVRTGPAFPFPLGPNVRAWQPEVHLERHLPAPSHRLSAPNAGIPLPATGHQLILFEGRPD